MKKIAILSVSAILSTAAFATEPLVEAPAKNVQVKKVKRHKKMVNRAQPDKPIYILQTENKPVLLGSEVVSIPSHLQADEYGNFIDPIMYDDVESTVVMTRDGISLQLKDRRTGHNLQSQNLDGGKLDVLVLKAGMKDLMHKRAALKEGTVSAPLFHSSCQTVMFGYKLKHEEDQKVVVKHLNSTKDGVQTVSSCSKTDANDTNTTFHTKNGHIVDIGLNQKDLNSGMMSFNVSYNIEGRSVFPSESKAFIVSEDMGNFYVLEPKKNPSGPFYGVTHKAAVEDGPYHVLLKYTYQGKKEFLKTHATVN